MAVTEDAQRVSTAFADDLFRTPRTKSLLAAYESGEASFLRGILRSLVRERRVRDIESGGAFHLALLENGSLVISDPATGYWMALEAFGTDNRRVFAELLQRATTLDMIAMQPLNEVSP